MAGAEESGLPSAPPTGLGPLWRGPLQIATLHEAGYNPVLLGLELRHAGHP